MKKNDKKILGLVIFILVSFGLLIYGIDKDRKKNEDLQKRWEEIQEMRLQTNFIKRNMVSF